MSVLGSQLWNYDSRYIDNSKTAEMIAKLRELLCKQQKYNCKAVLYYNSTGP